VGQSIDPMVDVWDVLTTMWATPNLFKTLTNFTLVEFDVVVPTISTHSWSIGEVVMQTLGLRFDLCPLILGFSFRV
jgi:hypothetical protein